MVDEIKDPAPVKQSIKEVFFEEVDESAKVLIRKIISPASLGWVIVAWAVISVAVSIYIKANGMCDQPKVEAGIYFKSRLLCPVN